MSGFSGFYQTQSSFLNNYDYYYSLLDKMRRTQLHRGNAEDSMLLTANCGLAHNHFSAGTTYKTACLPFTRKLYGKTMHLAFAGELYNTKELQNDLSCHDYTFDTDLDEEVILYGFVHYGTEFFKRLDGVFSFALLQEEERRLYLVRDGFGCKPLFYTYLDSTLVFATELKAILAHPSVKPVLTTTGLNEIFGLGPARTPGNGVFEHVNEVKPGEWICASPYGLYHENYWRINAVPHEDSYNETIAQTADLLKTAVKKQCIHKDSLGALLSGGVDSSVVTALGAGNLPKNEKLKTFSFDYTDNKEYFKSNSFQPSLDRPYVDIMADTLGTDHKYLECTQETLFDGLKDSVRAHDLPAMADVDSSLLYFCHQVKKDAGIVLTGECADEVFGGYPWFHREDMLSMNTFPWTPSLDPRKNMLKSDFAEYLNMDDYVANAYHRTLQEIDYLPSESNDSKAKRRSGYLSLRWFMVTLLNRMERCSAQADLIARVPFADRALAEYIYNTPWDMKLRGGVVKNLLREGFRDIVPHDVLFRKKSPYPKTYHPAYEKLLQDSLREIITDTASPLHNFVDKNAVLSFIDTKKDLGSPWYGQLMAGPQMMAYLIQIDFWMREYHIEVEL